MLGDNKHNIEDIYPLSPMQEGMLFHDLAETGTGAYFEQYTCTYQGEVNVDALKRSWQRVLDQNPVLRTLVIWERKGKPLQIVRRHVELEWYEEDLTALNQGDCEAQLQKFLTQDQQRGFDLKKAPLMRMALFRRASNEFFFVWSFHHLLLDGWSGPLIFKNVFKLYQAFKQGNEIDLQPVPPYSKYIGWLIRQDISRAENYWKKTLKGFESPTDIGIGRDYKGQSVVARYEKLSVNLSLDSAKRLSNLSKQHQVTLNTIAQGAWAYLLSAYSGERDVVFGSTVSGRLVDIPDIEEMIGLFINTIPVRVKVDTEKTSVFLVKGYSAGAA